MRIKFYTNNSEINKADKDLTELFNWDNCSLKEGCSIQNPVIKVNVPTEDINPDMNYMYIEKFNRYYFITDVTIGLGSILEITGHTDVLTTAWNNGLQDCEGIVHRSEGKHNLYIDDGFFRAENRPKIQTKAFPNSFNSHNFVLLMAGQ